MALAKELFALRPREMLQNMGVIHDCAGRVLEGQGLAEVELMNLGRMSREIQIDPIGLVTGAAAEIDLVRTRPEMKGRWGGLWFSARRGVRRAY